jgi:hypothetical protein
VVVNVQKQKSIRIKNILFLCALVACATMHSKESDDEVKQVKVGNFAVDGTMQPGPALGFGQNIIDKGDTLGILYPATILGKGLNLTEITAEIIYGVRDDLSILVAFPTALYFKLDGCRSAGSIDTIVQLEYVPYSQHKPTYTHQVSVVGAMYFPTGDECKIPATGFGSPSFFLGVVAAHYEPYWLGYMSFGAFLPTKNMEGVRAGNSLYYQFGYGRNIAYSPEKWTLMWMLELSGTYTQRSRVNGIVEKISGSNIVSVGPALWFSTQRFFLQIGVDPVVSQHLFGQQEGKTSVLISLYTGIRF